MKRSKWWLPSLLSLLLGGSVLVAVACAGPPGLDQAAPATSQQAFLVTPRWAPDGHRLLVSGRNGVGLSLVDLASGALTVVDPEHRGEARFSPDGATVALLQGGVALRQYDLRSRKLQAVTERPAWLPPAWISLPLTTPAADPPAVPAEEATSAPPDLATEAGQGMSIPTQDPRHLADQAKSHEGFLLWEAAGTRVLFDPLHGDITKETADGVQQIVDYGAWGAQVSPQGRIAYCQGPLTEATLHVSDPRRGEIDLGRGAQPAWFADGSLLVYARPEWAPGRAQLLGSDLYGWEPETGRTLRLTATPGVAEMQPAPSPRGDRLAFADWLSGQVLVARWGGMPE